MCVRAGQAAEAAGSPALSHRVCRAALNQRLSYPEGVCWSQLLGKLQLARPEPAPRLPPPAAWWGRAWDAAGIAHLPAVGQSSSHSHGLRGDDAAVQATGA